MAFFYCFYLIFFLKIFIIIQAEDNEFKIRNINCGVDGQGKINCDSIPCINDTNSINNLTCSGFTCSRNKDDVLICHSMLLKPPEISSSQICSFSHGVNKCMVVACYSVNGYVICNKVFTCLINHDGKIACYNLNCLIDPNCLKKTFSSPNGVYDCLLNCDFPFNCLINSDLRMTCSKGTTRSIGGSCDENLKCNEERGLVCTNGICSCPLKENHYWSFHRKRCLLCPFKWTYMHGTCVKIFRNKLFVKHNILNDAKQACDDAKGKIFAPNSVEQINLLFNKTLLENTIIDLTLFPGYNELPLCNSKKIKNLNSPYVCIKNGCFSTIDNCKGVNDFTIICQKDEFLKLTQLKP